MTADDGRLVASRSGRSVLVGVAVLTGAISLLFTASNVMAAGAPAMALRFWPWSSAAHAARATFAVGETLGGRAGARDVARAAESDALAALDRSPINSKAARSYAIALLGQGRLPAADKAFRYAEFLTRRDLPTQLYLVEDSVGRGNVAAALVHYDRALRVSVPARALLFPILAGAAEQSQVNGPLAALLARRPSWWAPFLSHEIGHAVTPAALVPLILAARLDPADPTGAQLGAATLDRLVAWGRFDEAWQLQRRWQPGLANAEGSTFDDTRHMGPFAWRLAKQENLTAVIEPRGDGPALNLLSQSAAGEAGRQLVRLGSGPWTISIRGGGFAGGAAASLTLRCAIGGQVLANQVLADASDDGAVSTSRFVVSPQCRYAWLQIDYQPGDGSGAAWLDRLSMRRT